MSYIQSKLTERYLISNTGEKKKTMHDITQGKQIETCTLLRSSCMENKTHQVLFNYIKQIGIVQNFR